MATERSLKLRWSSSHYVFGRHDGVRVRVEAVCSCGVSRHIFVYRMLPVDPNGQNEAFFSHIASPPDLADYPINQPREDISPEWFRLSYVDVLLRSVDEADNFVEMIRNDAKRLIDTLNTMSTLMPGGDILFGSDCETDDSSLSSSSSSSAGTSLGPVTCVSCSHSSRTFSGVGVPWNFNNPDIPDSSLSSSSSSLSSSSAYSGPDFVELGKGQSSTVYLAHDFGCLTAVPDDLVVVGLQADLTLQTISAPSAGSYPPPGTCMTPLGDGILLPKLTYGAFQHPDVGVGTNLAGNEIIQKTPTSISLGSTNDDAGLGAITGEQLKSGNFGFGFVVANDFDTEYARVEFQGLTITVCYQEIL